MSQMTVDMAQRIVRHWREKKTHYGITAWEECQLAAAFLHAQGQPIVDLSDLAPTEPEASHAIGEGRAAVLAILKRAFPDLSSRIAGLLNEYRCVYFRVGEPHEERGMALADALAPVADESIARAKREIENLADFLAGELEEPPATFSSVPEGWRLVPVNVTQEMQRAYFDVIDRNMQRVTTDAMFGRHESAKQAYRAMLAAAPQPEACHAQNKVSGSGTTGEA